MTWLFVASSSELRGEPPINQPGQSRPPVHPRLNVESFAPTDARYVRFTILRTNGGEPCIDELEIYSSGVGARNVALASAGAKVTGSGSLPGYQIHELANINDGLYGNGRSWISSENGRGWVIIEFPEVTRIDRVVWGRDREGKFIDRLATEYRIEAAVHPGDWHLVASSADRQRLDPGAAFYGVSPSPREAVNRFAPVTTSLSADPGGRTPEYLIETWQTENGLPSNTVSAIVQTRDGYLWIGTLNGLVRFDGAKFRLFGENEGLANNRINCLFEDRAGRLWIGTDGGGLMRYDGGQFDTYTTADGLCHNVVLSIAEDQQGVLWIGTLSGLNRRRNGKLESVLSGSYAGQPVLKLATDASGLWLIVGGALRLLERGQPITPPIEHEPARFSSLYALCSGPKGELWFGGANAYVACWRSHQLTVFSQEHQLLTHTIWEICQSRRGDIWIGMASGGLRRLREGQFTSFSTQEGLSSNSIRALCEDNEGNLWVGANGGGLMRLKARKVMTYLPRDGLSHEVIMSLAEDAAGQLWIASNCGGLSVRRDQRFSPASLNYLLDNACIWSLLVGQDQSLWIGTWGLGLFHRTEHGINQYTRAEGLGDDIILALCEATDGALWIGTYQSGVDCLRDGHCEHWTTKEGLSANFVTALTQDRSGAMWIGTSGGGLDELEGRRLHVFSRADGLGSDFVRTLYADAAGTVWIGTSGGLSRWQDGKLTHLSSRQGLKDDCISQILEDDAGRLWLGSNQGIARVSKRELARVLDGQASSVDPVCYGKGDGMDSLECTGGYHPAGLRARDGRLWFSTVKGLVEVDPELPANPRSPPVRIEEMLVDGRRRWSDFSDRPPAALVQLPSSARRIEVDFTALSFTAPEKVRFRHRLEPLERDWVEAHSRRRVEYNHLAPGAYRFRATACNEDGLWNERGATLAFEIVPSLWQTSWFRFGAAGLALVSAATGFRSLGLARLKGRLRRLEEQHALEKERSRIAHDIHDDLGATLTQIAFLSDLVQKKLHAPAEAERHLSHISAAARDVVRTVDQIVWAINPKYDSLDHLANYLSQFAQDFFNATPVRCRLDIPATVPAVLLSSEERHNLLLACKEAYTNVLKHSNATEVWVRLSFDSESFVVQVQDNGCGFSLEPTAPGHDGIGNMRQRLRAIGGQVAISSQPGRGTHVTFRVHFKDIAAARSS